MVELSRNKLKVARENGTIHFFFNQSNYSMEEAVKLVYPKEYRVMVGDDSISVEELKRQLLELFNKNNDPIDVADLEKEKKEYKKKLYEKFRPGYDHEKGEEKSKI